MNLKALVVCPTYGRIPFLNRMLASFLSQTYQNKNLVVVNDDKNIELVCDYPNVHILNLREKIILPKKRNMGNFLVDCDIIFPYDDDDIFLPNRLQNHIDAYNEYDIPVYRNDASYVVYDSKFITSKKASPNDISYKKSAWLNVGGYMNPITIGEDQEFFNKHNYIYRTDLPEKADYVYNWSGVNYHATYATEDDMISKAKHQLESMGLFGGTFKIVPDFEEYNKFIKLQKMLSSEKDAIRVSHIDFGKIEIIDYI